MKIKSIKAITLSMPFSHGGKKVIFHGKEWKSLEFNLVKIETDKGITGWGEAFGYTSWKAVKIAIEEMVAPLLVGKDMSNIPELLLTLQKSLHLFGRYGITMFAISGVEIALWDALGKEKNKPIYELLGKNLRKTALPFDRKKLLCFCSSHTYTWFYGYVVTLSLRR